ncbi:MAG: hypothetical protein DELT_01917 [Desulfovibrio sp.]
MDGCKDGPVRRYISRFVNWLASLPVKNGYLAMAFIHLAVLMAGLESAYVQLVTTHRIVSADMLPERSFLLLLCLDLLLPLTVALLSRRALFVYFAGQCIVSTALLHYSIFFYNPLTLSTIYHSLHGAASLGIDIFAFARWDIIGVMGALFVVKSLFVQLGRTPDWSMPKFWGLRGITAVGCMAVIWVISSSIYGRTGMSVLWVDSRGHRTATERRMEEGTREAVRTIGYLATWIGEWVSGTYRDTELIYAEARCGDPDEAFCAASPETVTERAWNGLPMPPVGRNVVFIQVESLDFGTIGMRVNGKEVTPFLNTLARSSLMLKTFAPHKVGSSNADYEILNARLADQNVIYYSYIKAFPDSVVNRMAERDFATSIFHGLSGNLFNLREAYRTQGFQHLVFKEELLGMGFKASSHIMNHVMDEDLFRAAGKEWAHTPEHGRFQFIITMSSHIPFLDPLPEFKSAGGIFSRYVSSLHYTDACMAAFYHTLPEGTVLVLWGDHGSDVDYPSSFPPNERHVPFMAHVKGETAWLGHGSDASAQGRVYTLCELGYYLRKAFR